MHLRANIFYIQIKIFFKFKHVKIFVTLKISMLACNQLNRWFFFLHKFCNQILNVIKKRILSLFTNFFSISVAFNVQCNTKIRTVEIWMQTGPFSDSFELSKSGHLNFGSKVDHFIYKTKSDLKLKTIKTSL